METDFNLNVTFSKDMINDLVKLYGVEGTIKEISTACYTAMVARMADLRQALTNGEDDDQF